MNRSGVLPQRRLEHFDEFYCIYNILVTTKRDVQFSGLQSVIKTVCV